MKNLVALAAVIGVAVLGVCCLNWGVEAWRRRIVKGRDVNKAIMYHRFLRRVL